MSIFVWLSIFWTQIVLPRLQTKSKHICLSYCNPGGFPLWVSKASHLYAATHGTHGTSDWWLEILMAYFANVSRTWDSQRFNEAKEPPHPRRRRSHWRGNISMSATCSGKCQQNMLGVIIFHECSKHFKPQQFWYPVVSEKKHKKIGSALQTFTFVGCEGAFESFIVVFTPQEKNVHKKEESGGNGPEFLN